MSMYRGHPTKAVNGIWYFVDTNTRVKDDKRRACGRCGQAPTAEDHDACLGTLPFVRNACCGHGSKKAVYIQWHSGKCVRGNLAMVLQAILKLIGRIVK